MPAPTHKYYLSTYLATQLIKLIKTALFSMVMFTVLLVYLMPLGFMFFTALKHDDQFRYSGSPNYPAVPASFSFQGQDLAVYAVPLGKFNQNLALVSSQPGASDFIDPANPDVGLIHWTGNYRTLERVYLPDLNFGSFPEAWVKMSFPMLFRNTLFVTLVGELGVLASSIAVAYGFSRFRIPGERLLFAVLIITIMIPESATLLPTYTLFAIYLKWTGTWLPLLAPLFFGNAVYIFLLRQNFKMIPQEQDEAAMLDGASPLQILVRVILPQSWPVLVTVAMLHFFYAWNEVRQASMYLGFNPDLYTIAFGIQDYRLSYGPAFYNLLMATALMAISVPVVLLLLAQRQFLRNVRITGLEK